MTQQQTKSTSKPISDLKARARGALFGHYGTAISATLLYGCFSIAISSLVSTVSSGSSILSWILYYVLGILAASLVEMLRYGICGLFIRNSCRKAVKATDIFCALKEHSGRIFPAVLLIGSFSFLGVTPWNIYTFLLEFGFLSGPASRILQVILALGGLSITLVLYLNFCMTYYLLIDFPKMSSADALKMSAWLMQGHKLRFLLLQASFLPLQFLGLLSCGIGTLFVYPYQLSCESFFYLNLTAVRESEAGEVI